LAGEGEPCFSCLCQCGALPAGEGMKALLGETTGLTNFAEQFDIAFSYCLLPKASRAEIVPMYLKSS
jgi:hypothetical protein